MALTLAQAQTMLDAAIAAYKKALKQKSYNVGSRSQQRQDVDKLRDQVAYWERRVDQLGGAGGGIRMRGATPT